MNRLVGLSIALGLYIHTGLAQANCVNPASFGAVPNDGMGDSAAIQQALDSVPLG